MAAKKPKTTEQQLAWVYGQLAVYEVALARLVHASPNAAQLLKALDADFERMLARVSEKPVPDEFLDGLRAAHRKLKIRA